MIALTLNQCTHFQPANYTFVCGSMRLSCTDSQSYTKSLHKLSSVGIWSRDHIIINYIAQTLVCSVLSAVLNNLHLQFNIWKQRTELKQMKSIFMSSSEQQPVKYLVPHRYLMRKTKNDEE